MKFILIILSLVVCILGIQAQSCNDLDTEVCKQLSVMNPNMCADGCLSSICTRFCGRCPLSCYFCHQIDNPANCTTALDCPTTDHYCFTSQTFTDDFHEVYTMGCAMKTLCERNVNNGRRSDLSVKGGCCNIDRCNNILPSQIDLLPQMTTVMVQNTTVPPSYSVCKNMDDDVCLRISLTDPAFCSNDCIASVICPRMCRKCFQCYSCNDINRPEDCNSTSTCESGKECFQLETLSFDLRPVYRLGCLDESLCKRFGVNPAQSGFGRRQTSLSLKGGCCKTDLCNIRIPRIPKINPPPSTITTSTKQQPVTLSPTTNCPTHHATSNHHSCPTDYTYVSHEHACFHIGSYQLTWQQADIYCKSKCGKLADFRSSTAILDVMSHVKSTFNNIDLWIGAAKDSHGHWIWTDNNQKISLDHTSYLNRLGGSCGAAHNSRSVSLIPHSCTTRLHPLCEAHRQ